MGDRTAQELNDLVCETDRVLRANTDQNTD